MKNQHNFLTELNSFIAYCNDFYNIETGIYRIATDIEIIRAIGEYLTEPHTIDIQFDSVDRENVRDILEISYCRPGVSFTRFNRHANMTSETLDEIMDILNEVDFNTGFDLTNILYGLFDGYLYDDLLEVARGAKIDNALYNRVENIVSVIKNYKI